MQGQTGKRRQCRSAASAHSEDTLILGGCRNREGSRLVSALARSVGLGHIVLNFKLHWTVSQATRPGELE